MSASEGGTQRQDVFGGLPIAVANQTRRSELSPLLEYLGFGPQQGSARYSRQMSRLDNATGPLAGFLQDVRGFAGDVIPQSQQIGQEINARGSSAFETLQSQIQQSLAALPQFQQAGQQELGYAQRFAQDAFSPTSQQPLFQEASRQLLDTIRPGLAARGLTGGGAGEKAESDATRDLAFQFGMQQRGQQEAAIPLLGQAAQQGQQLSQAGVGLGEQGMQAVSALGPLLQQIYQQPLGASGGLLSLLTAGQAPNLQLLGQTSPQFTPTSKSSPFGIGIA